MTVLEQEIHAALIQLEDAAARRAPGGGGIRDILERLDRLGGQLPSDTPGDLRHFMQRKSYEKARQFLEGRAAEGTPGSCRH